MAEDRRKSVVIVGGGFAGLNAASGLGKLPVKVYVIDRKNHHTFQPLLYQVATAGLSPGEIAAPIRGVLGKYKNVEVLLGEVTGFDLEQRRVKLKDAELKDIAVGTGRWHSRLRGISMVSTKKWPSKSSTRGLWNTVPPTRISDLPGHRKDMNKAATDD